jgi:hypothetical protein
VSWASSARAETRFALEANVGMMISRTVRYVSGGSSYPDSTLMPTLSVSEELSVGPLLLGASVGGALGGLVSRFDGFAGGLAGAEIAAGRVVLRLVGEGGLHLIEGAGGDFSYEARVPSVALPYIGARAALETRIGSGRSRLWFGASPFARRDVGRRAVSGSLTRVCTFDPSFFCSASTGPADLDVGGTMIGFSVSLTWRPEVGVGKN